MGSSPTGSKSRGQYWKAMATNPTNIPKGDGGGGGAEGPRPTSARERPERRGQENREKGEGQQGILGVAKGGKHIG